MSVINVTEESFDEEVLQFSGKVLVDFWAAWCGPCKMLAPTVDELSEEVKDVKFCKVNIDEQPQLAMRFGIMSIPTLMLSENGKIQNKLVGLSSKEEILDMLRK